MDNVNQVFSFFLPQSAKHHGRCRLDSFTNVIGFQTYDISPLPTISRAIRLKGWIIPLSTPPSHLYRRYHSVDNTVHEFRRCWPYMLHANLSSFDNLAVCVSVCLSCWQISSFDNFAVCVSVCLFCWQMLEPRSGRVTADAPPG